VCVCVYRLRVFENEVLKIFGPKSEEVTGGWRKLHNEELHNLYSSPNIFLLQGRRLYLFDFSGSRFQICICTSLYKSSCIMSPFWFVCILIDLCLFHTSFLIFHSLNVMICFFL
jgi:hypothetical protein